MPRKMRTPKIRISTEITENEFEWFTDQVWGMLHNMHPARQLELWDAYREDLMVEYRNVFGLFCRCRYWWEHEAREPRLEDQGQLETQKSYFLRHAEMQTSEERQWLKSHNFSTWELMSASESEDEEYFRKHPEVLDEKEAHAFTEYLQGKEIQ